METRQAPDMVEGAGSDARYHPSARRITLAPRRSMQSASAVNQAVNALWPALADAPGLLKGMAGLFGHRAAKASIRDWRRGKRKPPQWAIALLLSEIEKRIKALEHVQSLLREANELKR